MIRRPPRSTLFPTRRSSDLIGWTAGLLFKTTDGGKSWSPIGGGLPNTYPSRLVSDPLSPTTLYAGTRSEEHTSEIQSQSNLVCRLLLEKKKAVQLFPRFPVI